jgi:hypothetical protein
MTIQTRKLAGLAIMLISITMFFWWGVYFHIFGSPIRPTFWDYGFFGWIYLGLFGFGFAKKGWRTGLKYSLSFLVVTALAVGIGVLRGAYG